MNTPTTADQAYNEFYEKGRYGYHNNAPAAPAIAAPVIAALEAGQYKVGNIIGRAIMLGWTRGWETERNIEADKILYGNA